MVYTVEANCHGRFNLKPKKAWLSISVLIYCWTWPLSLLDSQSQQKENTLFSPLPTSLLVHSPTLLPVPCCDLCWSALSCNSFIQNGDRVWHTYTQIMNPAGCIFAVRNWHHSTKPSPGYGLLYNHISFCEAGQNSWGQLRIFHFKDLPSKKENPPLDILNKNFLYINSLRN